MHTFKHALHNPSMSPLRPSSSTAGWRLASPGSVTFTPWQSATTTCSRAFSSQRRSSKSYFPSTCTSVRDNVAKGVLHKTITCLRALDRIGVESNTVCGLTLNAGLNLCLLSALSMMHSHAANETQSLLQCSGVTFNMNSFILLVEESWMVNRWCASILPPLIFGSLSDTNHSDCNVIEDGKEFFSDERSIRNHIHVDSHQTTFNTRLLAQEVLHYP